MFLDPEMSERQKFYPSSDLEKKDQETKSVEKATQKEKEEVREDVIQHPEFSNVAWNVASEVSSKYTDMEQLKKDRTRFQERLKSKSDDGKGEEYAKVWEKKIRKGFDDLIKALEEKKYFDDCKDNEAKTQKVADIMVKYSKEVHAQYEKYIWSAENKTFNSVKDTIFTSQSTGNPVEKIYKELTWATTISKVDRTYVEWYEADILDWTDTEDKNESMSDRKNRKFLSDDLPQYLWDIRKTPWVLNVLKWLPIFSVKEDRPSKVDRKAIKQFLKTSSKINVEWNKDKAVALMEALHDNRLNTNSGEADYENVLKDYKITVDKKYLDDIVKAGAFYINTQRTDNDVRDQHAIYLSVLKIIESEGSVDKAVKKFQSIVEQGKKDKKAEKKEGYESGEKLWATNPELYEIAKNLWITDFASATRLSEKDADYFKNTPVEKILANLNNDRVLDARDTIAGWSKTWLQFLEIFKQVWKEKALSNLVEHAKLLNKTLWVGLPDALLNADTIEADIKWGHTWLILLLQDIINKPGEDLYTLLSWHSENPFEGIDLTAEKASADKAAAEMIKKMDLEALKKDGLTLPTPESMQSWLATALYTEYKRGIWLWGKVSFDQWIKWVELNTGFQVRDGGVVMVWIGIDYRKKINLWKWWSTTPELSAWTFIPLGMWKPELSGSVGLNDEVAKERITKKWIKEHLGVQGGITLMPAGVLVLSAWFKWEQDKAAWIESAEQKKMIEFRDNIISPILDRIYEERKQIKTPTATKLNFNDPSLVKSVKAIILAKAIDEKVPEDKREMVTNAVMRLLLNYKDADLAQEWVRDIIAQWMAEQYAMAWAEDRKAHVSEKAYLSWANLGTFWVVGSPLVWIYAWIKFTKHDVDGYGDKWWKEHELDTEYQWEWNQKMLDSFNQQLWLSDNEKLRLEWGFVVVSKSFAHRVNVNTKMKWLMKKDKDWNILLHPQTPMSMDIRRWTATQGTEIVIWWNKWGEYVKLDTVWDDWFTENINQNDILELGEGLNGYSSEVLNKALATLKSKFPKWDPIHSLELTKEREAELIDKLNKLDKSKKAQLLIAPDATWKLEIKDPVEWAEWRWLEIKYQAKVEMLDDKVKDVTEAVYAEADKVTCNVLNLMCHHLKWYKDRRRPEYLQFAEAMNNKDYAAAKPLIIGILKKLDTEINKQQKNKVNFSEVATKIEAMTDEISLWQALMSVNNIFARSIKVVWKWQEEVEGKKISKYGLTVPMGNIIKEREGQIRGTVSDKVEEPRKSAYLSLIDASKKYREKNPKKFNIKESKAAQLSNTVWFNLWNSINPENPLFNPEIYEQMVDMKDLEKFGFDEKQKDALHERTMRLYAENSALINPILKALWLEGKEVKIEGFETAGEKWKLKLDIWWKKVTLSAWMKFGYFTQCVNHTVILEGLSAETQDGTNVTFNSGVWENGRYVEGNKSTILSTTEVGGNVSFIVHDGTKEQEEKKWDGTTNMKEEEEDIPNKNDETTKPNKQDDGPVDTWWWTDQWWEWDSGKQWGWREWDEWGKEGWDNTPPTWGDWQNGEQNWWWKKW